MKLINGAWPLMKFGAAARMTRFASERGKHQSTPAALAALLGVCA